MKTKSDVEKIDQEIKELKREMQEMKSTLRELIQYLFKETETEDIDTFSGNN